MENVITNRQSINSDAMKNQSAPESDIVGNIKRKIISYSIELPIESIVSQINDGIIKLNSISERTDYQRDKFWNFSKASRLVETVLLKIPIQSCYFAQDYENCFDIMEGRQRILSLYRYLNNDFALKKLEVVHDIMGKKYSELPHLLQKSIRMSTLRCVVIAAESDPEVKYNVFEKLNSDATPLNHQEIRNRLYKGGFIDLLGELASEELWLEIRSKRFPDKRLEDEEIILRFFSFLLQERNEYKPPLKHWLNSTAQIGSELSSRKLVELKKTWHETLHKTLTWFEPNECFRRPNEKTFNKSLFDLITYSVRNTDIEKLRATRKEFRMRYKKLLNRENFNKLIINSIDSKKNTFERIKLWEKEFSNLGL